MVHWHVTVYIMFVYCTCMKACMQKKKKKKIEGDNFLTLLIVNYITLLLLYDYTINTFIFIFPYLCGLPHSAPFHVLPTNTTLNIS